MVEPTMMLISCKYGNDDSFKMIPITNDCPYSDVFLDTESKTLVIISKEKKQIFHMLARLNDDGELIKASKQRSNNKTYKEERKIIETCQEYYVTSKDDIKVLINLMAINAGTFDYLKYFENKKKIAVPEKSKIIMP